MNLLVELLLQGSQVLAFTQNLVAGVAHLEAHLQVLGHGVPVKGFGFDDHAAQAAQHEREGGEQLVGCGGVVLFQGGAGGACHVGCGHEVASNRLG